MLQDIFSSLHEPYLTVLCNIITFLVLSIGTFVYRFIYPKRHINFFVLALLFSILPVLSLLREGVPQSGDFTLHTVFLINFVQSLGEGNFFPQWAAISAGGYGYPAFEFMYLTPFYLGSLFHFLGFDFISSIKLVLISSYLLSCVAMYVWAKEEFGPFPAFVATIFYQFAPFYLIEMHYYQSVGMVLAFTMVPLTFYCIRKFIVTQKYRWFFFTSVSIGLSILTHQTMATFLFPVIALYVFILYKIHKTSIKILLLSYLTLAVGIGLFTYYWFPLIVESQYIIQGLAIKSVVSETFLDLLYSPWGFGFLLQGRDADVKFLIGYAQWIIIVSSFFLLLKKQISHSDRVLGWFFLLSFFVLLVLILPIAHSLWELPILNNFRSTNRLLLFEAFFVAALAAIVCKHREIALNFLKTKSSIFILLLCLIAIGSTLLTWANRGTIPTVTESVVKQKSVSLTDYGLLPIWLGFTGDEVYFTKHRAKEHIKILSGKGKITEVKRTTTTHRYDIVAESPLTVVENTLYFPGWSVLINSKPVSITYTTKQHPGRMVFSVPKGKFLVEVIYGNSPTRQIAQTVSIIVFCGLLLYPLVRHLLQRDKKKARKK